MSIDIVHIASPWLTSKCWQQLHTKAHLGTRVPDPQGREPHAESSTPFKVDLPSPVNLFWKRPTMQVAKYVSTQILRVLTPTVDILTITLSWRRQTEQID